MSIFRRGWLWLLILAVGMAVIVAFGVSRRLVPMPKRVAESVVGSTVGMCGDRPVFVVHMKDGSEFYYTPGSDKPFAVAFIGGEVWIDYDRDGFRDVLAKAGDEASGDSACTPLQKVPVAPIQTPRDTA